MEITSLVATAIVSLTTALGVCLVYEDQLRRRLRRLEAELKSIRIEWENAWSLIDSAAKRAVRYSKLQDAPGTRIALGGDAQAARQRVLALARQQRGG